MTRAGQPITIYNKPVGYEVIEGQKSLFNTKGVFRGLLLGVKQGGVNKQVNKEGNAIGAMQAFLARHKNAKAEEIKIEEGGKTPRGQILYTRIPGCRQKYKTLKSGELWSLMTVNYETGRPNEVLTINAKKEAEFKKKLAWVLNKPESQNKLEYRTPYFPLANKRLFRPFGKADYIFFNEAKIVSNQDMEPFRSIDHPGEAENYKSRLGRVDMHSMNYYAPLQAYQGYSSKEGSSPTYALKVRDQFWEKQHDETEFLNSSAQIDELLGNLVNQHYPSNHLTPVQRGLMIQKIREDFIYDVHGTHSRLGRIGGPYQNSHSEKGSILEFGRNPLRGNRYIRFNKNGVPVQNEIPPCLQKVLLMMYTPTGDGGAVFNYDTDPEKFMHDLRHKLKIHETDRQYMMGHGRKVLAIRVALNFLSHEISAIKLDEPGLSPEEKETRETKWRDLCELKDAVFRGSGDMKNTLRKGESGYVAFANSARKGNIPDLRDSNGETMKIDKPPENKAFKEKLVKGLYDMCKYYTYYEDLFGWQFREKAVSMVHQNLQNKTFDRDVPRIVGINAAVLAFESMNRLSVRLKFITESLGRDTDAYGYMRFIKDKVAAGDFAGVKDMLKRYKGYMMAGIGIEPHFPRTKMMYLHADNIMWEREVFGPPRHYYRGENQGIFTGNYPSARMGARGGAVMGNKLAGAIREYGKYLKAASEEMEAKNTTSAYETNALRDVTKCIQSAAKEMATQFLDEHEYAFKAIKDSDMKIIYRDIYKEFCAFLQMIANVTGILANSPARVYGPGSDKNEIMK